MRTRCSLESPAALQRPQDFRIQLFTAPGQIHENGTRGASQAFEVAREQKGLLIVRPERFVNVVAKQESVIEHRNPTLGDRHDNAVDVDNAGGRACGCVMPGSSAHASEEGSRDARARSQNSRCLSALAIRRGSSMAGNSPKWIFIGAKFF